MIVRLKGAGWLAAVAIVGVVASIGTGVVAVAPLTSAATATERADRVPVDRPQIDGPVRTVAFIGDSILADYRQLIPTPPESTNETVPLVRAQLDLRLGTGAVAVWNHAVGGLAVKYPLPAFTQRNLRAELSARYAAAGVARPDLVVIGVSSIDLANVALPIEQLAPELVRELRLAVVELDALGIEVLILPVVPVAEALFGYYNPAVPGLAGRIRFLDESMARSDLPMLFESFDRFDDDRDGAPDDRFYTGYHHRLPDDGIHLNRAGQYVHAGTVGPVLADVIQRANTGRRS